jgi:hypothetical protein
MEHGAIDLHKNESQVRILTESGEVIDQRIRTTRDRLTAVFWGRPHARILIEARPKVNGWRNISRCWATKSSWRIRITARCMGIVADA